MPTRQASRAISTRESRSSSKAASRAASKRIKDVAVDISDHADPKTAKLEGNVKLANLREKLHLISLKNHNVNFEAIADLVEEARFNKSAIMQEPGHMAQELHKLMATPQNARHAVTLREITEFGRNLEMPYMEAVSERRATNIWYHALHRLKLAEFNEGDTIVQEGDEGPCMYWLLVGDAVLHASAVPSANDVLEPWDMFGAEALQGKPYVHTVTAASQVSCACLSQDDYLAVLAVLANETFDSLKFMYQMLMNRAKRTMQELKDLAAHLSLLDLFKTMEDDFRVEVCNLVEYLSCPEGFTLFEEGDKIDFCYIILHGEVVFSKHNSQKNIVEEIARKTSGNHFGTLSTLSGGERKRPFAAVTTTPTQFAIISRVGYNRVLKKQLQGAINARVSLLKTLAVMDTTSYYTLQKVALNCQDESFAQGVTIAEPQNYHNKMYIIMEGECKLVWITEDASKPPVVEPMVVTAAAAQKADAKPDSTQQQLGNSQKPVEPPAMSGYITSNGGAGHKINLRRRQVLEVARLARGDVLNGSTLFNKPPTFHIVACTQVKLVSMESDSVEAYFGRDAYKLLKELVVQQHDWSMEQLERMISIRQAVSNSIMDPAVNRTMHNDELRNFLPHFVPTSATGNVDAEGDEEASETSRPVDTDLIKGQLEDIFAAQIATVEGYRPKVRGRSITRSPRRQSPQRSKSPARSPSPNQVHNLNNTSNSANASHQTPGSTGVWYSDILPVDDPYGTGRPERLWRKKVGPLPTNFAGTIDRAILDISNNLQHRQPRSLTQHHPGPHQQQQQQQQQQAAPSGRQLSMAGPNPTRQDASRAQHHASSVAGPITDASKSTASCSDEAQTVQHCTSPAPYSSPSPGHHFVDTPQLHPHHSAPDHGPDDQIASAGLATSSAVSSRSRASSKGRSRGQRSPENALAGSHTAAAATATDPAGSHNEDSEVSNVLRNLQPRPGPASTQPLGAPDPTMQRSSTPTAATTSTTSTTSAQATADVAAPIPHNDSNVVSMGTGLQGPGAALGQATSSSSPLPRLPQSQSPLIVSPSLPQKVILQTSASRATARFCKNRAATLVSGVIGCDGGLDLDSMEDDPTEGPACKSTVVILPRMMNVYASVLDNSNRVPPYDSVRRARSPHPGWGPTLKGSDKYSLFKGMCSSMDGALTDTGAQDGHAGGGAISLRSLTSMGRRSLSGSRKGPKVRRARGVLEEEVALPLEVDLEAPKLQNHHLSRPTLQDIEYILHRWGDRWSHEREEIRARKAADQMTPRSREAFLEQRQANMSKSMYLRPLEELQLFGLPAAPGVQAQHT